MSNSNRFSLAYTTWNLSADGTEIGHVGPVANLTIAQLQEEIDNSTGGTVNLIGKAFSPSIDELTATNGGTGAAGLSVSNTTGAELAVTGGVFKGGVTLAFSGAGPIKEADLSTIYGVDWVTPNGTSKIHDSTAAEPPYMAVWPEPPEGMKSVPQTANSEWIDIRSYNPTNTQGTVYCNVVDYEDVVPALASADTDQSTYPWSNPNFPNPAFGEPGEPEFITVGVEGKVTGFQIADATDKAGFDAVMATATNPTMLYLSANNIVAETTFTYDNVTGTVTFPGPGLTYAGYLLFAITGSVSLITEEGQYVVDTNSEKVFYQPVGGEMPNDVTMPLQFTFWENSNAPATSFTNSEFYGTGGHAIRVEQNPCGDISGCTFQTGNDSFINAVDQPLNLYDNSFDNVIYRGAQCSEGSDIQRNRFTGTAKSSGILIQGKTTATNGSAVEHTTVKDNYFSIPQANHGQGISLYQGAWMNATVEHNLFVNCQRAFAHQGYGKDNSGILRQPGTFKFFNNLVLHDYAPDVVPSGQTTVSFNSYAWPGNLPFTQKQYIINNTILHDTEDPDLSVQIGSYSLDYYEARYSNDKRILNNLCGRWTSTKNLDANTVAAKSDGNIATLTNITFQTQQAIIVGQDVGGVDMTGKDQTDVFEWDTLTQTAEALTSATDGGIVGHRWDNGITMVIASDPPTDWYTQYPALPIPETDDGVAFFGAI
jgi:hypothetical protein